MTVTPPPPLRAWFYACVPAADRGGVQVVFRRVARALAGAGHVVTVAWAHPVRPAADGETWVSLETDLHRPVSLVPGVLGSIARLARALRRDRPDVVNVHFPRGEVAYFLLLRPLFGYRLVLTLHGSDLLVPAGPARHLLGPFLRRADSVVTVSGALRTQAIERHSLEPARVRHVPNGIDVGFWGAAAADGGIGRAAARAAADAADSAGAPVRLVAVGRLVPVKGFDLLVDALALLREGRPDLDVTLELAGTGSEADELARRVEAHGLGDRVRFAGHLDAAALRALLRAATLFVMPSRSEGMPLALLEAMAAGACVLATDVGGTGEILDALPECLVAPGRADLLARGIARLLDDPALRGELVPRGRRVASAHDAASTGRAYEALFAELAAAPPRARFGPVRPRRPDPAT